MIPLIAAGIGAAATLGGSAIQSYYANKAAENELDAKKEAAKQMAANGALTQSEYNQIINNINSYYNQRGSLGTAQDANAYKQAIASYNPEDYAVSQDLIDNGYQFNGTVDDYLNPYYSRIIGDTANSIQHTAAGAGLGRGTGAALNIAKGVSEKSDELYRTAMSDYQNERDFAYKQYQDNITNNQNRLNALNQSTQYKMGLQGNLASDYYNAMDARQSDLMNAYQDKLNSKAAYDTAIARTLLGVNYD